MSSKKKFMPISMILLSIGEEYDLHVSNTKILNESNHFTCWYIWNVINEVSFFQFVMEDFKMDLLFEHFILYDFWIFNFSNYFWRKALKILEFLVEKIELAL
jgi:hypothetical protein